MIRSTRPRLTDIDTNITLVFAIMQQRTRHDLQTDTALRYAILHALMIIAEAVRHLPKEDLAPHATVPWSDIVGIGVMIKHEYHRVDPDVVWNVITVHLKPLQAIIRAMLTDVVSPGLPL